MTDLSAPAGGERERTQAVLSIAGIAALNFAISSNHGNYDFNAVLVLIAFIGLLVLASVKVSFGKLASPTLIPLAAVTAMVMQGVILSTIAPSPTLKPEAASHIQLFFAAILTLLAAGVLTTATGPLRAWTPTVLIFAFGVLALWVLRLSDRPFMDVHVFQQDASAALAHGQNPYAITFPNIYGPGTPYYAPEVVRGDRVTFGYPYMPLPLLTEIASWLAFGDVRYAHLACLLATFAILLLLNAGPLALTATALFALTPELARINFYGWIEPLMFPWLALTAWAMRTRRAFAAAAFFGLFLASKQYCVIFVPLVWMLVPGRADWPKTVKLVLTTIVVGAIVTLPLVLWDFKAFWYSAVTIQMQQPFRPDALSLPALMWNVGRTQSPGALPWLVLVPAYGLVFKFLRATPSGMMLGIALTGTLFFALNKQAFLNYYSLIIAALAIGLAHLPLRSLSAGPASATAARPDSASIPR